MNEVSKQFGLRLLTENSPIYESHYPLIHFLIMHNQYKKLLVKPEYCTLPEESKKIADMKWFKTQTRRILRRNELLTFLFMLFVTHIGKCQISF